MTTPTSPAPGIRPTSGSRCSSAPRQRGQTQLGQSQPKVPVWDNDVRTGVLPGGLDGEVLFVVEAARDPLRLEGVVTAVRGTCPNIGIRVNDRIVRTFERTVFEGQRCSAIAVRDRILVLGRPTSDDLFGALRIASRKP